MNEFCVTLIASYGSDLSSRRRASFLRDEITHAIDLGAHATIDFAGVRTVSSSFADELVAILVRDHGEDWFREKVSLINLSDDVRRSLLEAVDERCRGLTA